MKILLPCYSQRNNRAQQIYKQEHAIGPHLCLQISCGNDILRIILAAAADAHVVGIPESCQLYSQNHWPGAGLQF